MRDHTSRNRHKSGGVYALILTALLAIVAFAGCLGGMPGTGEGDPEAALIADTEDAWAGEPIEFDGSTSTPPEGSEITHWRFELGDETVHEAEDQEDAKYEHEYEHGGVFEVTLTVTAESEDGENLTDTDELIVVVNDRYEIDDLTVANPVGLPGDAERDETEFMAYEHANGWLLTLEVENNDPALPSEFSVRILDGDNETLEEETRQLDGAENATIELSGSQPAAGDYTFELVAENGTVSAHGRIDVLYAESM